MNETPQSHQDYENYRKWIVDLKDYPEKKLNSRLRKIVDAIPTGSRVLDVACGTGRVLKALVEKGCSGRGIDISHSAVEKARQKGLDVIEGDVDSWSVNPEIAGLLFDAYDAVIFSKCLIYLKTKNEIIERLNTGSIFIFQGNSKSIRSLINGESAALRDWNGELPYQRKDGSLIRGSSAREMASWAASYGYNTSKVLYGGFLTESMVLRLSRDARKS